MSHDQSYMSALHSDKCMTCWNLDPRGHPLASTLVADRVILSTVQLQYIDSTTRYDPNKKCGYCKMIKDTVGKFFPFWECVKDDLAHAMPKLTTITLVEKQPALLTVLHYVKGRRSETNIEVFKGVESKVESLPAFGTLAVVAGDARSDETAKFIRDCVKSCITGRGTHRWCQQSGDVVPTRLVQIECPGWDLSSEEGYRTCEIRWKVVCADVATSKYAALSHCWGKGKHALPKLEKATEESKGNMAERFRWSSAKTLPETFKDGMYVALMLGLDYIWIDSLCIIQNCDKDWADEAAKMGEYYQSAFLTIAAGSSEAGAVPFLRIRPAQYKHENIRFYGPAKKSIFSTMMTPRDSSTLHAKLSSKVVEETGEQTVSWGRTKPSNSKIPGPLATRTWTLQEHILSTRILHFTDEGVRWECRTCNKSEDGRVCLPSYLQAWNSFTEYSPDKRDELQAFWRLILIDYTSREVSFRKDILIALSGVAERMHRINHQPYLAGLWEDRIIEDLCWMPAARYGDRVTPTHYKDIELPTWSWISVRHPATYAVVDEKGTFTARSVLQDYAVIQLPGDTNPFGRVCSGALVLLSPVVECELTHWGQKRDLKLTSNYLSDPFNVHFYQDAPLVKDDASGLANVKTVRRMQGAVPFALEETKWLRVKVYCMYLGDWVPEDQPFSLSGVEHRFVLVMARSARVPDAFERIGIVKSDQVSAAAFDGATILQVTIV
jgi:hypothetical protein